MFEFRLRHERKCPQVGSEPRFSQMEIVRGRGTSCGEVWWGKWCSEGSKGSRVWGGDNTVARSQIVSVGFRAPVYPLQRFKKGYWRGFLPQAILQPLLLNYSLSAVMSPISVQHLLTLYIAVSRCTHLSLLFFNLPQTFNMLLSTINICLGFKSERFGK